MAAADPDCIFCKVVSGEIPAEIVEEDERTISLLDINPWTRGHALVIPRRHARNILDVDDDELARVASAAKRLARRQRERLDCDGVNLLSSAEAPAWQTIFHFHVHVIPRYEGDPLQLPTRPEAASKEELAAVAEELRG